MPTITRGGEDNKIPGRRKSVRRTRRGEAGTPITRADGIMRTIITCSEIPLMGPAHINSGIDRFSYMYGVSGGGPGAGWATLRGAYDGFYFPGRKSFRGSSP